MLLPCGYVLESTVPCMYVSPQVICSEPCLVPRTKMRPAPTLRTWKTQRESKVYHQQQSGIWLENNSGVCVGTGSTALNRTRDGGRSKLVQTTRRTASFVFVGQNRQIYLPAPVRHVRLRLMAMCKLSHYPTHHFPSSFVPGNIPISHYS